MKILELCATTLLLAACVTDAPERMVLPSAQTVDGVRIQVTRVRRSHTRYFGLAGEATNLGTTPAQRISAIYQILDTQGAPIGQAHVEETNLAPGEIREFEAEFSGSGVSSVGSIMPGRIRVLR